MATKRVYYTYFDRKTETRMNGFVDVDKESEFINAVYRKWKAANYLGGSDIRYEYSE